MSPNMKDLLTDEVRDLPTSPIPVDAVISDGRRRLRRHRATGGTAAFAAVATLAALAVQAAPFGGVDGFAGVGEFEQRKVTYATASTIHYGGQEIDVSPHQVWSFVQTDDGFVFTTESGDVYLTGGQTVEQIGDGNEDGRLAADDTGSYVAWVDSGSEAVVYDTADRAEVTRTAVDGEPVDGVYVDDDAPYVEAVDGDVAYWRTGEGVVAWDLTTQSGEIRVAHPDEFFVQDIADGQIAQVWTEGTDQPRDVVVNADPDAKRPRFPLTERTDLSPSARYLAHGDGADSGSRIYDVTREDDVTPSAPAGYHKVFVAQWIDDDRYVAQALPEGSEQVDLLRCSTSAGRCTVAAEAVGSAGDVLLPVGALDPYWMFALTLNAS